MVKVIEIFPKIVDETADDIEIQVGMFGYSISKTEFQDMINGFVDNRTVVLNNMALSCALSGADTTDMTKLKLTIEGRAYKVMGG